MSIHLIYFPCVTNKYKKKKNLILINFLYGNRVGPINNTIEFKKKKKKYNYHDQNGKKLKTINFAAKDLSLLKFIIINYQCLIQPKNNNKFDLVVNFFFFFIN